MYSIKVQGMNFKVMKSKRQHEGKVIGNWVKILL
jgi:hypothetical protein